jgi:predicted DCC family thiol-disulfide oxidoreductase YuxK
VAHYRRLDKSQCVHWVDISREPHLPDSHGISMAAAMARLHVRDPAGNLHTGAYAFHALWLQLPYYRWLGRCLARLGLLPMLDWIYGHFARWRLQRHCDDRLCATGNKKSR